MPTITHEQHIANCGYDAEQYAEKLFHEGVQAIVAAINDLIPMYTTDFGENNYPIFRSNKGDVAVFAADVANGNVQLVCFLTYEEDRARYINKSRKALISFKGLNTLRAWVIDIKTDLNMNK
jgi:hypothetical protein